MSASGVGVIAGKGLEVTPPVQPAARGRHVRRQPVRRGLLSGRLCLDWRAWVAGAALLVAWAVTA